ncbi:MAG: RNase A-like domain-containing protein [Thermoanaerobaculia bacterium]
MARQGRAKSLIVIGLLLAVLVMRFRRSGVFRANAGGAPPAAAREIDARESHDLAADERLGGHTLERHIGRTEPELALRLEHEGGVNAASSFLDRPTAERVIAQALEREHGRIEHWLEEGEGNLAFDFRENAGVPVGHLLRRGAPNWITTHSARVVLRKRDTTYFVLTAYPVEP